MLMRECADICEVEDGLGDDVEIFRVAEDGCGGGCGAFDGSSSLSTGKYAYIIGKNAHARRVYDIIQ